MRQKKADMAELPRSFRSYRRLKQRYPDRCLLVRVNNVYLIYGDDAREVARILGITLQRICQINGRAVGPIEMASFPYSELDVQLPRLIRAGQRVAICDTDDGYDEIK